MSEGKLTAPGALTWSKSAGQIDLATKVILHSRSVTA